ncbi:MULTISPECIES: glycoside hydrolase family 2 protein [unclassified Microbacterium]|uniref:glycoside hydrolase family 2 protein n=1 Tax=unclassified Microbacterium TaxID=2609290 RepID=UPI00300FE529
MSLQRRLLHEGWTVRAGGGPGPAAALTDPLPAEVPGCVHVDLLAAGVIDDPFVDDNEAAQRWIGQTDWVYESSFDWHPGPAARHDLLFEGLDTIADVFLNGAALFSARNQHRPHGADVTSQLREGTNRLEVRFTSPVRWAIEQSAILGARPRPYPLPYEAIRKSASSFGWDWGIHTATSGIWRPVALESWSVARIERLTLHAQPQDDDGTITADVVIRREPGVDDDVRLVLRTGEERAEVTIPRGSDHAALTLHVRDVQRWWPVGYGAQPRYEVAASLLRDDVLLDTRTRRVGFRTVHWDTNPDDLGTPFALHVNDVPVPVRGVNWIPDDALVTRVDDARCTRRLQQALDAHVNLIRVWGGGLYESEHFYETCDELGLLTWQDFLFACAAYPEEEPLRSEIEAEARAQISRLADHPSLVLLCGNNENLMGYDDWGWQRSLDGATWGEEYYRGLLPDLVHELAPWVPYAPGSPFSPDGRRANDEQHGPSHLWEQWNRDDWRTYRRHTPRFAAEFGWQGPPTWTTLTGAVRDRPLTPESPGMLVHQKAENGNAKLRDGLLAHARVPRDMADWHWAMQWNQAAAMRFAIDRFRTRPGNAGTILWQLNDSWPVTSWSAIDYGERRKPLWYALRQAYAPRRIVADPVDGEIVLLNGAAEPWKTDLVLRRIDLSGAVRAETSLPLVVAPRGASRLPIPAAVQKADDPRAELLVAAAGAHRAVGEFAEPRDTALEPARLEVAATPVDGGSVVRVTAENLVRDLTLMADRVHPDAEVDDALVTLLPGESVAFRVSYPDGAGSFDDPLLLRSLNDLVG